ncbi:MAG: glutamate--tRNA ligase family protein [Patescibacteria group bacterium]
MVRVRIAPSPTGFFHIGTARTALFNYLFAKKHGGTFVLRIEDTDKERSKKEYEQDIYEEMQWLGLVFDERYVQSEHVGKHKELLHKLIDADRAYVSKEPAKDDSERMVEVVRLRNPGTTITFADVIRGDITFDTTELKDFIIARSIDDPLYHFAVVVDDGEAKITHVIRGEDHISNTPRQILIQEALGLPRPVYAHLPLILMPDRTKMSKRKHETGVKDFRAKGYLPEAVVNFLALLGWSPKGDIEILSMDELIAQFELADIHKAGAVFNEEKLRWFNREYLLRMPENDFASHALLILKGSLKKNVSWNEAIGRMLLPILRERISVWDDIRFQAEEGEYDYFFTKPHLEKNLIPEKKSNPAAAHEHLAAISMMFEKVPAPEFTAEHIHDVLWPYAEEKGRGAVLWPLRYALSGREKSPDPFVIASILGKNEVLERIRAAHAILE